MKRIVLAALVVGALALVAFPYEGTIVFQGGHGAKALGMGGAFCALSDDATGALWNPAGLAFAEPWICLLYTSPSPRDRTRSRMPSSA